MAFYPITTEYSHICHAIGQGTFYASIWAYFWQQPISHTTTPPMYPKFQMEKHVIMSNPQIIKSHLQTTLLQAMIKIHGKTSRPATMSYATIPLDTPICHVSSLIPSLTVLLVDAPLYIWPWQRPNLLSRSERPEYGLSVPCGTRSQCQWEYCSLSHDRYYYYEYFY